MNLKKNKTHFFNEVYEKQNRYIKPKEIFTNLIKIFKKEKLNKKLSLIDVGCANGELLYNLHKNFKNLDLTGIDVDNKLLKKAKLNCPSQIKFKSGNIGRKINNLGKFDIIILSGVLSIFNNGEKIMKNLFLLLKPKGKIFIFDSLNIYSHNLYIKSEEIKKNKKRTWYKNMYCTDFFKNVSKRFNKKCRFYEFRLSTNLKKNKNNFRLGWTEVLSGKKIVTNGLGLIQNQFWIKIF